MKWRRDTSTFLAASAVMVSLVGFAAWAGGAAEVSLMDDANAAKWKLGAGARWIEQDGERVLEVSRKTLSGEIGAEFSVDVAAVQGKALKLRAEIQLEGVSKPPPAQNFLGAKCVLFFKTSRGAEYPEPHAMWKRRHGTHDWFVAEVELMMVTMDTVEVVVRCGMQEVTGTVRLRRMTLEATEDVLYLPKLPDGFKCEYTEKCRALPRLRGVMSPYVWDLKEQDVRDLAKWGANVMRWQFAPAASVAKAEDYGAAYLASLDKSLERLEALLPVFEECGIYVIIDLHGVPGGRVGKVKVLGTADGEAEQDPAAQTAFKMFFMKEHRDVFVLAWERIARRFKDRDIVVAYDLMNEPDQRLRVKYDYLRIQEVTAKLIRRIDAEKPVIVTVKEWAHCRGFVYLKPIPVKNVFYTFHEYEPGDYTHQGVYNNFAKQLKGEFVAYPNDKIDRAWLAKKMAPAREFQRKWGARIYVGEFGVVRCAPGAAQWLDDVIALFEESGWDWTYHAFREWINWSAEHSERLDDWQRAAQPTDRLKVLQRWMQKNN